MQQSSDSTFAFVLEHLRWSLDQPMVFGERHWATRVMRALERVTEAFDQHVQFQEASDGPFDQLADTGLLPFTPEVQHIAWLRASHQRLRAQLHGITAQFRDALLFFPAAMETSPDNATGEGLQEVRAFRLFGVLEQCARDVATQLHQHLVLETSLLRDMNLERLSVDAGRAG